MADLRTLYKGAAGVRKGQAMLAMMKTTVFGILLGLLLFLGGLGLVIAREAADETFTTASCTGSTGEGLAANLGRRAALLVNDGTSTIWIKVGEDAVANEGIRLNANGGSYYISSSAANYSTGAVNCITASATVVILVSEWSDG